MKRFKSFGIALIAMFALTATLAATASAAELPNILPEATGNLVVTAQTTSAKSEFGSGLIHISAPSSTGIQVQQTTKLGYFTTTFEGFKDTSGRKCTGLTSTKEGQIVTEGTFHIRDFDENGTLLTARILLLKEAHFSCGTLLILLKGCLAGHLTPENVLTKTLDLSFAKPNNTGIDNLIITVLNEENNAKELCQLLSKTDEQTAFTLSSQEQLVIITNFKNVNNGIEVAVLVMRL